MMFRKFKKTVLKYFDVEDKDFYKSYFTYAVVFCYLKCDKLIRFEIRYYRKIKFVYIHPNSYTNNTIFIEVKRNLEAAIIKLLEEVIKEHVYWRNYYYKELEKKGFFKDEKN